MQALTCMIDCCGRRSSRCCHAAPAPPLPILTPLAVSESAADLDLLPRNLSYLAQRDGAAAELQGRPRAKLVTMGFGYDLNTKLLVDLATAHRAGESDYAFVPDGTMVLTNFVNLMANLRSTCARRMVRHNARTCSL
eukprot:363547-Chlamydomonas_euryale.AAC.6